MSAPTSNAAVSVNATRLSPVWQALAVAGGIGVLTLSSYVQVPMQPVPLTLQTLAVTLVGAVLGWRLGVATILAWLAAAAAGLPVLAGVTHLAAFAGPTAGYLMAFPAAGALCGWLAERGWDGRKPALALASMVIGNALCLVVGAAWLSLSLGVDKAIMTGVAPFLIGGALKSAMGAAALTGLYMVRQKR